MKSSRVLVASVLAVGACGDPAAGEGASPLGALAQPIIGGYVDEGTRGAVALGLDLNHRLFIGHCSGTLIAPNLVMTARHCIAGTTETTPDEGVVCGETEFTVQGPGGLFLVSPETRRPQALGDQDLYRGVAVIPVPGANDICGYDVALIRLDGDGIPASEATPIVPRIDAPAASAEVFSATGFGVTEPQGNQSGLRMRVDGNTVRCSGEGCQRVASQVRPTEWLSTDAPVCSGDSGGPALDAEGRVIGVASRGSRDCGSIIYGDVAAWSDFIIETAVEAAAQGGYDPPFWTRGTSREPPVAPEASDPPLGMACDSACEGGYVCYAETGSPPGICVPKCEDVESCPLGYACAENLGACVPERSGALDTQDNGGCAFVALPVKHRAAPVAFAIVALGAFRAFGARRRRCVAQARKRSGGTSA